MILSQIVSNVVNQHAEESSFNWVLRDKAVSAPHYSLDDLAKLDTRIDAHIDGLRIAGDDGWEVCQQQLEFEEPGEVFTAAVLALESKNQNRIQDDGLRSR